MIGKPVGGACWLGILVIVALTGHPALSAAERSLAWMPAVETYASEAEAHDDFRAHVSVGDDISGLIDRMRSRGAWIESSEDLMVSLRPRDWGIDLTAAFFEVPVRGAGADAVAGNYDSWRYMFAHRDGILTDWGIQRHYFGPDFAARSVAFRIEDFERSERGWQAARDAILQLAGPAPTPERINAIMTEGGFGEPRIFVGKEGTRAEGISEYFYSQLFSASDSLNARIIGSRPGARFLFAYDQDNNLIEVAGGANDF